MTQCSIDVGHHRTLSQRLIFVEVLHMYQIKSNLFAQQLTLYRQNHIHLHVLKTYYMVIFQIYGYIK